MTNSLGHLGEVTRQAASRRRDLMAQEASSRKEAEGGGGRSGMGEANVTLPTLPVYK